MNINIIFLAYVIMSFGTLQNGNRSKVSVEPQPPEYRQKISLSNLFASSRKRQYPLSPPICPNKLVGSHDTIVEPARLGS